MINVNSFVIIQIQILNILNMLMKSKQFQIDCSRCVGSHITFMTHNI